MAVTTPTADNISNVLNILKYQYGIDEDMLEVFNNYNYFYRTFGKAGKEATITKTPGGGYNFIYPLLTAGTASWGVRGDMTTLPPAQAASWSQLIGGLWFCPTRFRISGLANILSREDRYAYFQTLDFNLKQVPKDYAKMFSQMCYRDGSGAIARNNATTTGTTITVHINHSVDVGSATSGYTFGTDHMRKGMEISMFRDTTKGGAKGVLLASADKRDCSGVGSEVDNQVSSITNRTTWVAASSVTGSEITNNYYFTPLVNGASGAGEAARLNTNIDSNSYQLEIAGMGLHLNAANTSVHGINKSTNAFWQPAAINGTEGSTTAFNWNTHVLQNVRAISNAIGADRIKDLKCVVSPTILDRISLEFDGTVRTGMMEFKKYWGYDSIKARRSGVEVEFIADIDAWDGSLMFFDPRAFKWIVAKEPQILDDDGLTIRNVTNQYAFEGMYGGVLELACLNPKFAAVQYGIATS